MDSKFSTNIRFIREIPRYNSRWLRVTKQQHRIANLFVSRAHKFRYVQNSIATLLFSIVVADHCDRWIIYRSRFSTHTLVEKKKEKEGKKKDRGSIIQFQGQLPRAKNKFRIFDVSDSQNWYWNLRAIYARSIFARISRKKGRCFDIYI